MSLCFSGVSVWVCGGEGGGLSSSFMLSVVSFFEMGVRCVFSVGWGD